MHIFVLVISPCQSNGRLATYDRSIYSSAGLRKSGKYGDGQRRKTQSCGVGREGTHGTDNANWCIRYHHLHPRPDGKNNPSREIKKEAQSWIYVCGQDHGLSTHVCKLHSSPQKKNLFLVTIITYFVSFTPNGQKSFHFSFYCMFVVCCCNKYVRVYVMITHNREKIERVGICFSPSISWKLSID